MKAILFCQNAYAFGILAPIRDVLQKENHEILWFITPKLLDAFPFKKENFTTSILALQLFESDAIFAPGNEVPYYLRGVKVQIFHGLAGEKKGHFRIRHYFDLYLTQGPYFTEKFLEFKTKYQNFEVIETGWPKLDIYRSPEHQYQQEKIALLKEFSAKKIILYAPTFSPSLTSAPFLLEEIKRLAANKEFLILFKFHDLMDPKWIEAYKNLAQKISNALFIEDKNIIKYLLLSDLMISDTSSVIYEFLLLDKPVISFNNISKNILWLDSKEYEGLSEKVKNTFKNDTFEGKRKELSQQYHPYNDGNSAERMVQAVEKYITKNGVPNARNLSFLRKRKIHSIFGKPIVDVFKGPKINKISALLITYNEEEHINGVLENLQFADEIIVVDSFSTDKTINKLKEFPNVKLIQRPFKNFTDQKSFALEQATNNWILFIDADERLTDALKNEVLKTVNSKESTAAAYYFLRTFMFQKKKMRFSGTQSDKNYRLFQKSKCKFDTSKTVHETLLVDGQSLVLKNKLIHYSYNNYEEFKGKRLKYTSMQAKELLAKNKKPNAFHFIIKPAFRFFKHYVIGLGFLDGKKGLILSYLMALGIHNRYKELQRLRQEKVD